MELAYTASRAANDAAKEAEMSDSHAVCRMIQAVADGELGVSYGGLQDWDGGGPDGTIDYVVSDGTRLSVYKEGGRFQSIGMVKWPDGTYEPKDTLLEVGDGGCRFCVGLDVLDRFVGKLAEPRDAKGVA